MNASCTQGSAPNVFIAPSQTVTMMDDSSYATTLVWVVVSLVGLLLFLASIVVVGIILFVRKKKKKQKLAELRSVTLLLFYCDCNTEPCLWFSVKRMTLICLPDTPP